MNNIKNLKFIACMLLVASAASADQVEYLACNSAPIQFEKQGYDFSVIDTAGSGVKWGNLSDCGFAGNFTQGTGNALCVKSGASVPGGYDTSWESNEFTLVGADTATLQFSVNYQDINAVAGNDRMDIDVSVNGGPWETKQIFQSSDRGIENTIGGGLPIFVNLNAQTGNDKVKVRFHYYDPNVAPDSGIYAMVDNVALVCTGGADLQTTINLSKNLLLEGDEVTYTVNFHNAGPKTATEVMGLATLPPGFSVLSSAASQGAFIPSGSPLSTVSLGALVGTVPNGQTPTVTVSARAGIAPEVLFDIQSPAAVAGTYEAFGAMFGPAIQPGQSVAGGLVLADDGVAPNSDGCQPLVNQSAVAGRIVITERDGSTCADDERVKNVQDAGGSSVVVIGEPTLIPVVHSTESFYLKHIYKISVMRPSGNVVVPITIPSVIVSRETGTILKNNLVNSVSVAITGVPVLAQQYEVAAIALGKEFDSDFPGEFVGLLLKEGGNNMTSSSITVLKDSDRDLSADINEECDLDPAKTAPGACGCGRVDTDTDSSGIADCLSGAELKFNIAQAKTLIGKLKNIPTNLSAKKIKARKAARAQIRSGASAALAKITSIVSNPVIEIGTVGNPDLSKLSKRAVSLATKALKASGSSLLGKRQKAQAALNKLQNALA